MVNKELLTNTKYLQPVVFKSINDLSWRLYSKSLIWEKINWFWYTYFGNLKHKIYLHFLYEFQVCKNLYTILMLFTQKIKQEHWNLQCIWHNVWKYSSKINLNQTLVRINYNRITILNLPHTFFCEKKYVNSVRIVKTKVYPASLA